MSLGFKMASAKTQLTVGGVGCLLSMLLGLVKLQVGTINIIKQVFIFLKTNTHSPR